MLRRLITRRRLALALAGVLVLYMAAGFVGVPLAIHHLVLPRVNAQILGTFTLAKARFNPFTLRLVLGGLDVRDEEDRTVISATQVVGDLQWSSLWRSGAILKELSVSEPFVHIGINPEGEFRLMHLFKLDQPRSQPAEPAQPSEPMRLAIAKLAISGGQVLISDDSLPTPFEHRIGPMDLAMEHFDTLPQSRNPHRLVAVTQTGETLEWEGWFHLNPLSSEGQLKLSGITTEQYDPYARTVANFRVKSGRISISAEYRIDLSARPITVDGSLASYLIDDAQLVPLDSDEPFLHVGQLALRGARWNLVDRTAHIEQIELRDGHVLVHRHGDGVINWQTYFKTREPAPAEAPATPTADAAHDPADPWAALMMAVSGAGGPWDVVIGGITVEGHSIRWQDDATPRPARTTLLARRIDIDEVRSDDGYRLPIHADLTIDDAPVSLAGEVVPMPAAVSLAVKVDGLGLAAYDPYVEQHAVKARFRDGRLFVHGDVTAALDPHQPPRITFRGDVRIDDFSLTELSAETDRIVAWRSFALGNLTFDSSPLAITLGTVRLDQPYAAYIINEDGRPAVASLLVHPPAEQPPTDDTPPAPSQPLPVQSIGEVTVTGGSLAFVDKSQQPTMSLKVAELEGRISSLSLAADSRADIQMTARLQDTASAVISGQINPLLADKYMNMRVALQTLPMATFDAFSRRYLGHMIDQGMLTFEFPLTVVDRKLEGEIRVALDKFYLGDRVESPEATKLPVGLALNLLRDTKDMIVVNVPIRGDLDDPKFRVGHLVVQAILNTTSNVLASPFKLIAGAIGAGEEDLSGVDFEPGRAELLPGAVKKLELLARAMTERPALKLQMTGDADRSGDIAAMKKARLTHAIRVAMARRLAADDPAKNNPDSIPVLDGDYRAIVAERYAALQSGELTAESGEVAIELPRPERPTVRRVMRGGRMQTVTTPSGQGRRASPQVEAPTGDNGVAAVEGVVTFAQMEQTVLDAIAVSADDLAALASARADAARQHMIAGGVEENRITVTPPADKEDARRQARVEFTLQ